MNMITVDIICIFLKWGKNVSIVMSLMNKTPVVINYVSKSSHQELLMRMTIIENLSVRTKKQCHSHSDFVK